MPEADDIRSIKLRPGWHAYIDALEPLRRLAQRGHEFFTDVDRLAHGPGTQPGLDHRPHGVVDVGERARLRSVADDRERLATQQLAHEDRHHAPARRLGTRLTQMNDWLDHNAGADGWAMTPSGERGVLNDALSIHFADATIASAFVARWCIGYRPDAADGVYRIRGDEPTPRIRAPHHKTP